MAPANPAPAAALLLAAAAAAALAAPAGAASATPTRTPPPSRSPPATPSPTATFSPGWTLAAVAGREWDGAAYWGGDGGPALNATLRFPAGLAVDASGALHVAEYYAHRVRRVDPATGAITTVAGSDGGASGFGGDGGPATSALLSFPRGLAFDAAGNLWVADSGNSRVRRIAAATGAITTVAGGPAVGFSGDGGPASSAELAFPAGVAVDTLAGHVYVADTANFRLRRIAAGTGVITTVAGGGSCPGSPPGAAGVPATSACLGQVNGVAAHAATGAVYLTAGPRVYRLSAGVLAPHAGNGTDDLCGDGGPATAACVSEALGVAVDAAGNVYAADTYNGRIRRVAAGTGVISTIAGGGGVQPPPGGAAVIAAGTAALAFPTDVAVDGATGALYLADVESAEAFPGRVYRLAYAATAPPGTPSPTPSSSPYCAPGRFRRFPRMDLVGALAGTALAPGASVVLPTEDACRQACCDAPACDGYAYDASSAARAAGAADCWLYVNVTQLVPSSGMASGVLRSVL
jgi:DNA-binding beta-propeller fold protein YncE